MPRCTDRAKLTAQRLNALTYSQQPKASCGTLATNAIVFHTQIHQACFRRVEAKFDMLGMCMFPCIGQSLLRDTIQREFDLRRELGQRLRYPQADSDIRRSEE